MNYSLPDIFTDIDNIGELVTWKSLSIIFSFITITFSIVLFSDNDKKGALAPLNIVILVLKVFMDLISRVLIFFTFMIVHNGGEFSPMRTLTSFYTVVGIMFIFNIIFNERRNVCSNKYWLDVLINSYSSTLSFNQVDLQNMMDPERKKRPHQSKFVKQFCYYIIVFFLQISLTAVTLVKTGAGVTMFNTEGRTYNFTSSQVFITLGVGWAAFGLALIFNLIYYVLHPSQVNVKDIQEKLVVAVVGYEINFVDCSVTDLNKKEKVDEENDEERDEERDPLQMKELADPIIGHEDLEEVVTTT